MKLAVTVPVLPGKVPYLDFAPDDKEAIEEALRIAWERLPREASHEGKSLWLLSEVEITELLQRLLNALLDETPSPVRKFSSGRFETVVRGGELRDYAGMSLEKRPDLVFRYCGRKHPGIHRRQYHGLFVECKIIDETHPERLYGQDGIVRFVRGEYAWAMPSAMMIAYVRNGATVPRCLAPHLAKAKYQDEYRVKTLPKVRPHGKDAGTPPVYISLHERPEVKVAGVGSGDIAIAHLWLQVE